MASALSEKSFKEKGWTVSSYTTACKECVSWIDNILAYENVRVSLDRDNAKIVESCVKSVVKLIKSAGRGLSDVVSANIPLFGRSVKKK